MYVRTTCRVQHVSVQYLNGALRPLPLHGCHHVTAVNSSMSLISLSRLLLFSVMWRRPALQNFIVTSRDVCLVAVPTTGGNGGGGLSAGSIILIL